MLVRWGVQRSRASEHICEAAVPEEVGWVGRSWSQSDNASASHVLTQPLSPGTGVWCQQREASGRPRSPLGGTALRLVSGDPGGWPEAQRGPHPAQGQQWP